jgi:hypothetical protein
MEVILMSRTLEEQVEVIEELIRTANNLINPEDSLAYLQRKDLINRLYGTKPSCFLKLQPIGRDTSAYLLPLCNRMGMEDPKVIAVSMKIVKRFLDDPNGRFDVNILNTLLSKLQHRHSVLIKKVPHPAKTAARKANVTKMFNNIKSHLDLDKTRAGLS